MNNLADMLVLLALAAIVGLWLKLSAARERAVQEARRQCQQHGLQLLDETVGLRAIRLRRHNGMRMLERCYGFEVSTDGDDREPGHLWMVDGTLIALSLPTVETVPHEAATPPPLLTGNVVPLHPRQRANDRLH